jgi:hypothetical protein
VEVPAEAAGVAAPGDIDKSLIDALMSVFSAAATFASFFDDKLDDSDFVSGDAALDFESSLAVGNRTLFGSLSSMNFSSIFKIASSVI